MMTSSHLANRFLLTAAASVLVAMSGPAMAQDSDQSGSSSDTINKTYVDLGAGIGYGTNPLLRAGSGTGAGFLRLSAFLSVATQADSEDRSAAAFLVTSVLETQRHTELINDEHDALKNSRAFVAWAVNDAITRGELSSDTDVNHLVEMLVAVVWGMGFYAGFVGDRSELTAVVHKLELLLANKLWNLSE